MISKIPMELWERNNLKILDPCCGLGNFLTKSIQYLNSRYFIDWTANINNIIGYDIKKDMVGLTKTNIFLDTNIYCQTIHNECAIKQNIVNCDIVLSDVQFGKANVDYDSWSDKIKELNILNHTEKVNLESLFVLLVAISLNINGRSAILVPSGFLSDDLHNITTIRSYLLTNYNLKKIVYIGDNIKNSYIKQVILYFSNETEKTTKIEYCEINYMNGAVEEKKLLTVSINDIISNEYKLDIDDFKNIETKKIKNMQYVKLKDICKFEPRSNRKTTDAVVTGKYPFYTSSSIINYCDYVDYNSECLIISMFNNFNIRMNSKFSCSSDNYVIKSQYNRYLLYWFQSNTHMLDKLYSGNVIKQLSKHKLENIEIPLPTLNTQKKIISHMDSIHNQIKLYQTLINTHRQNIRSASYYDNLILNYDEVTENNNMTIHSKKTINDIIM